MNYGFDNNERDAESSLSTQQKAVQIRSQLASLRTDEYEQTCKTWDSVLRKFFFKRTEKTDTLKRISGATYSHDDAAEKVKASIHPCTSIAKLAMSGLTADESCRGFAPYEGITGI